MISYNWGSSALSHWVGRSRMVWKHMEYTCGEVTGDHCDSYWLMLTLQQGRDMCKEPKWERWDRILSWKYPKFFVKFQNEYIFVPTLFSRGAGSGHRWGQPGIEWWCGFSLILQCYQLSCMTMVRMRQLTGLSLSSVGTTSCVATGGGALWTGPMSAMRSGCWWWGACLTWTPSGGRVGTHRIETVLVQTLSWDRIY